MIKIAEEIISLVAFADVIIMAESEKELQKMLDRVEAFNIYYTKLFFFFCLYTLLY